MSYCNGKSGVTVPQFLRIQPTNMDNQRCSESIREEGQHWRSWGVRQRKISIQPEKNGNDE